MSEIHYTLRQLQYFVAVAETGTMSGAAALCHVSQPGLSLAISQLERSLGVKLLVRNRAKGATLTPAGDRLLTDAKALLSQAEGLQEQADLEGGGLTGRLAVGCYATLAPLLIPALLTGFEQVCPGVTLEFTENPQPELQQALREGAIEVAFLYDHQLGADLDHVVVDRVVPYVLLPADHRFAGDDEVQLESLSSEPMILFDVPPSRQNWQRMVSAVGVEPLVGHTTQNFELARSLVGRGLGYALLLQRPPIEWTYEGRRVVAKPIAEQMPTIDIVLAHAVGTQLTARARRFTEFTIATLSARAELDPTG
ncbi:LysR family transcriptional regulator [Desertimonas flava]|uniref:LysR family transcriptional regulator n=1 Tax=Desertimonas flava TaxID=2064846 RepID=UPI000E34AE2E|nr:LysR family transcriptional regulator [Desertimonas flava]